MKPHRILWAAGAAASLSLLAPLPALAGGSGHGVGRDDQHDKVPGHTATERPPAGFSSIRISAVLSPKGTRIVSATLRDGGKVTVLKPGRNTAGARVMAGSMGSYPCVKRTTKSSNVKAIPPVRGDRSTGNWENHYIFMPYYMNHARWFPRRGYTTQLEQCVVGGSRNKSWNQRMALTEGSMSLTGTLVHRIGSSWGTGVDQQGRVHASLGFEVPALKAATVSGSLQIEGGGGHFRGGVGAGHCGLIGPNSGSGNQVNASWEYTWPGIGTDSYKGNVGHVLYEYHLPNKTSFGIADRVCWDTRY